jgi:hypothetical protein
MAQETTCAAAITAAAPRRDLEVSVVAGSSVVVVEVAQTTVYSSRIS